MADGALLHCSRGRSIRDNRPEQPVHVPPTGAQIPRSTGVPLAEAWGLFLFARQLAEGR